MKGPHALCVTNQGEVHVLLIGYLPSLEVVKDPLGIPGLSFDL